MKISFHSSLLALEILVVMGLGGALWAWDIQRIMPQMHVSCCEQAMVRVFFCDAYLLDIFASTSSKCQQKSSQI